MPTNIKTASRTINGVERLVLIDTLGQILTTGEVEGLLTDIQAAYALLTDDMVSEANQAQKTAMVAHSDDELKAAYTLYVLELENDKLYVGISSDLPKRLDQHKHGKGAKWTQLHKPISVKHTQDLGYLTYSQAAAIETRTTKQAIAKYGIENVRGGSICQIDLTPAQIAQYA